MKHSVLGRAHYALALAALALSTAASAQTYSTLMYFNGSSARGGLAFGTDGALYGIASESNLGAGALGGLIYRVTADGTQVNSIYQFATQLTQFSDLGFGPRGTLASDGSGNFYGVTQNTRIDPNTGAVVGSGTIFRLSQTGTLTRIYGFTDTATTAPFANADGAFPGASLLLGNDGFLYGSTLGGGANGGGVLFKVARDGTGFAVLHSFSASTENNVDNRPINTDGLQPQRLTLASNGDLYGVTAAGGPNGTGVIFRVRTDGAGFTVLRSFDASPDTSDLKTNASGAYPSSALIEASTGFLYGATQALGANGFGNVYRIALDGSGFMALKSFDLSSGGNPAGDLTLGRDGTLLGTTLAGGAMSPEVNGAGAIYTLALDGTLNNRFVLSADPASVQPQGASPNTGVIEGSDGSLYGTTGTGGIYNLGTVFKFGPATNRTPLGNPVPFDDGGTLSWWLAGLLALLAYGRIAGRRTVAN